MLFFFIGMFSLGVLITQIISFQWFQTNQDNNYHKIIDLWLKDPIEQLYLKDVNQDCPQGTSTFDLQFQYPGNSGLCICVKDDTYYGQNSNNAYNNRNYRILQGNYFECSKNTCGQNQVSQQIIQPINNVNLNYFFFNLTKNSTQKICMSKVPRYSFALKAPLQNQCESYEKYCDFHTTNKDTFDLDQGYCIPKDKECQIQGVNLGYYTQSVIDQLPIVDISISTKQKIDAYNVHIYDTINEKILLNMNNITYDSHYNNFLNQEFQINISHMPRVKLRCRQELQQNLSTYFGPESAYQISLALLIFSILSCAINFLYIGFGDLFEMNVCLTGCKKYCELKRVQKKNSTFKNSMIILKPILLIMIIILNGVMILCYTNMLDYMLYMVNDKCLDQYINQTFSYQNTAQPQIYQEGLTYTGLMLAGIQLLFDQMLYLSIKNVILYIYSIIKCQKSQKKRSNAQIETVTNSNLKQENKKQDVQNNATPNLNDQARLSTLTPVIPKAPLNLDIFVNKSKYEEKTNFDKQKTELNQQKYINSPIQIYQDEGQNNYLTPVYILGKSISKRQNDIELNLQQNQLINLNNQQYIPSSNYPIYQNQHNLIEDKKNTNNIQQFKKRRNSGVIQPPEAPLPPEQSEKSQFSIVNLDNI